MRSRRLRSRVLVRLVLTVGLVVAVHFAAPPVVRIALGLLVTLGAPGWLGFVAVRRRPPHTLTEVSVGVVSSIGVLTVLGILLNLLPAGLTPWSWSLSLLAVVLAQTILVAVRVRPEPDTSRQPRQRPPVNRTRVLGIAVPLALCLVLVGGGAATTVLSQRSHLRDEPLTELWATSTDNQQTVHVRNGEGAAMTYRLVVFGDGARRPAVVLTLADGEERAITLKGLAVTDRPLPWGGDLYRQGETVVYRQVHVGGGPS